MNNRNYQVLKSIKINELIEECLNHRIRSIDVSMDCKTITIGTISSEIFKLWTDDNKISGSTNFNYEIVAQGHYSPCLKTIDEIWGLAAYHHDDRFITVSDDSSLRIWKPSSRRLIRRVMLDIQEDGERYPLDPNTGETSDSVKLRSVAISPKDNLIAVGSKNGIIRVLTEKDKEVIAYIKDRTQWISDIKFSPNSKMMAVGSHDNYIDIYIVPEFKRKFSMRKHTSFITHLDWSSESRHLQSNCAAQELLYWDMTLSQEKQLPNGSSFLRNEQWDTWTCTLGWPCQGIWPFGSKGDEVNAVDRSHEKLFNEYHLLAAGDDEMKVKVYKYPCLRKGADCVVLGGHSSHVTNVKWGFEDRFLYSVGGRDGTVMVWKVEAT